MIRLKCNSSSSKSVGNILKKSVVTDGFEKMGRVSVNNRSSRSLRKERKEERLKNKGYKWYRLPRTKVTLQISRDLEMLRMRSISDPKRFYKKNDFKELPAYFQIGRVQETSTDFYNGRIPKRKRKQTIVDEMLSNMDFKRYTECKYQEILQRDPKRRKKAQCEGYNKKS